MDATSMRKPKSENSPDLADSKSTRSDIARVVVLAGESRHRFDSLHHSLQQEYLPATSTERLLVAKMAVAQWRQMRIWALEKPPSPTTQPTIASSTPPPRRFDHRRSGAILPFFQQLRGPVRPSVFPQSAASDRSSQGPRRPRTSFYWRKQGIVKQTKLLTPPGASISRQIRPSKPEKTCFFVLSRYRPSQNRYRGRL